ncbi:MAG TPA: NAD(P)H-dependent oxidoreductase subunit E, partial [Candidatus Limnocylindrales bacterium]|nr:NAD(P)H-dependent oxidoreductase subunit E [Candidatus Limnocylindrales bacterium]
MDLHVIGPLASPAERAAVDAVLGPPESSWVGGARTRPVDGHAARGGHAARARRDLLIPALHAVQSRIGWISQPAINYVCRRLTVPPAEAWGVATFYALFATTPRPPIVAHVCDDLACGLAGAEDVVRDLERTVGPAGDAIAATADRAATWLRSPCLGLCERAPAALVTIAGEEPRSTAIGPVDAVGIARRLRAGDERENGADARAAVPQAGSPGLRLLARAGVANPERLSDYRANGGYRALERALRIGPAAV